MKYGYGDDKPLPVIRHPENKIDLENPGGTQSTSIFIAN